MYIQVSIMVRFLASKNACSTLLLISGVASHDALRLYVIHSQSNFTTNRT